MDALLLLLSWLDKLWQLLIVSTMPGSPCAIVDYHVYAGVYAYVGDMHHGIMLVTIPAILDTLCYGWCY